MTETRRPARALLWAIGIITLVGCAVLVTDVVPWLRGAMPWIPERGQWVWEYDTPRWAWLVPAVAGVAIYVWGAQRLLQASARVAAYPVRLMLWAFGGAVLLPLLLLALENPPLYVLFTRAVSPQTGGYPYAAVVAEEADDPFADWPAFVRAYRDEVNLSPPSGAALSPPGLVLAYRAVDGVVERVPSVAEPYGSLLRPMQCQNLALMTWDNSAMASVWLQVLMPFWAALTVVPLYKLGTLVFDAASARLAVALWPLVPGLTSFQPRFNVLFALLAVLMLWLLWRGMVRNRVLWVITSGGVLSLGMFFNISLVPLGLLAGLTVIGWRLVLNRAEWPRLIRDLVAFGAGSISVWVAYWALSGQNPWGLVDFLLNQHYDLYRPYWAWLPVHPYDMFLFVGVPVTLLALWRIGGTGALRWRSALRRGDVFALAAVITLVVLVLSGTARGETGRVWFFFAPVWLLLAGSVLQRFDRRAWRVVLALQAVCLLSTAAVLRTNFTAYTLPPDPPAAAQAPTFTTNARFEAGSDAVTLVGLSLDQTAGAVVMHLHWRAETRVERPYVLALLGVGPEGIAQTDIAWNPLDWEYPPSCWQPGQTFVDTVRVPLGDEAQPGDWLFSLSIQDVFTQAPMQVIGPDGVAAQQFGIGPVPVLASTVEG